MDPTELQVNQSNGNATTDHIIHQNNINTNGNKNNNYDLPSDLSINDISLALQTNQQQQQIIQDKINKSNNNRSILMDRITNELNNLSPYISNINDNSQALYNTISISLQSTSTLSNKIKLLDSQCNRVKSVLNHVSSMIELRDTITLVETALKNNDLQQASEYIYKAIYIQLWPIIYDNVNNNNDKNNSNTLYNNMTYQLLKNLELQLYDSIQNKLNTAKQDNNIQDTLTYSSMLCYINNIYDSYILYTQAIADEYIHILQHNGILIDVQPPNSVIDYIDLLSQHYNNVAKILKKYNNKINYYYGSGMHIRCIQLLQNKVDEYVVKLLQHYTKQRKLNDLIKQIKAIEQKSTATKSNKRSNTAETLQNNNNVINSSGNEVDSKMLDNILDELVYILGESDTYDNNIRKLIKHAKQQLQQLISFDETNINTIQHNNYIDKDVYNNKIYIIGNYIKLYNKLQNDQYGLDIAYITKLNEYIQQLLSDYIILEQQYILQNINKAIQNDEHVIDEQNNTTSKNSIIQVDDDTVVNDNDKSNNTKLRSEYSRDQLRGLVSVAGSMANVATSTLAQTLQAQGVNIRDASNIQQQNILSQILLTGIGLYTNNVTQANHNTILNISSQFINKFKYSLYSTVTDDIFYILKKSVERVININIINGIVAIINHVNTVLLTNYKPLFYNILNTYNNKYIVNQNMNDINSITSSMFTLTTAVTNLNQAIQRKYNDDIQLLLTLNNCDLSIQYINTLKQYVNDITCQDADKDKDKDKDSDNDNNTNTNNNSNSGSGNTTPINMQQPSDNDNNDNSNQHDIQLLQFGLSEFDNTINDFIELYKSSIQLILQIYIFRLKQVIDNIHKQTYDITESYFSDVSHNNIFILFQRIMSNEIQPLQNCITQNNYTILIYEIIQYICNKYESIIMHRKFNFWGSLLLDIQIRQLYQYCLSLNITHTIYHIYNKHYTTNITTLFNRLKQITLILSCETLNEAIDCIINTNEIWVLSNDHIKNILRLRNDFDKNYIDTLNTQMP